MRRTALASVLLFSLGCRFSQTEAAEARLTKLPAVVTGAAVRPVGDPRRGYGSEKSRETLARLSRMGVNTIAVLIEGRMKGLADPDIQLPDPDTRSAVREVLKDAADLGLATVLVPHLYLDDGEWRGRIRYDDARAKVFFAAHQAFIVAAAEDAAAGRASLLSIGVELKAISSTQQGADHMRALAERVRSVFSGPLTYSANWDEAENVAFWDVVDVAGVNGYYPLEPDVERGAEAVARRLGTLADIAKREVLVLEVGYRSGPLSHLRPWEWPQDVPEDVDASAQARAWAAVLTTWLHTKGVRGLIVWVVPTDPDDPASEPPNGFSPMNKPAEEVIARAFRAKAP
ncbi:MAG: hypothetical protein HY791_24885 [Deltaproteobacteria bacterium]|nr:hypothetical protein [Deltaproteobacteria bacterium]